MEDRTTGDSATPDRLYEAKNANLNLSIDVMSHAVGDLYKTYLSWFLREKFPEPRRILDIGCDNGIITCFYASVYPAAEVIGVDQSANGLRCAGQLSERLGLSNVFFQTANISEPIPSLGDFDLVSCLNVLHEVVKVPSLDGWSLRDLDGQINNQPDLMGARLAELVSPETGFMIIMDRLSGPDSVLWVIRFLEHAGLTHDWNRSWLLEFSNADGENEILPLLVSKRGLNILAFLSYRELTDAQQSSKISTHIYFGDTMHCIHGYAIINSGLSGFFKL